ncbi:hypothetical protein EBT31_19515, partial [bacterium]|nr:hypothetical protein [bacterium]
EFNGTIESLTQTSQFLTLYDVVRTMHDRLEEAEKTLSRCVQLLSTSVLPRRFQEEGISTITMKELGARFTVSTRMTASMLDKDMAIEWLEENGYGDLVKPTVNSSTLSKFAAEYVLEKGQDLPDDLFKVGSIQITSRTKV